MSFNQNSTFGFGNAGSSSDDESVTAANNGLSLSGATVTLGQEIDEAGNPAALSSSREIPLGANAIRFSSAGLVPDFISQITIFGYTVQGDSTLAPISIGVQDTSGSLIKLTVDQATLRPLISVTGYDVTFGSTGLGIRVSNPTAALTLPAGQAAANSAPLKFTSGTNLTTGEAGAMEYNGTNLFFTRTGTTRENVLTGNSGAAAPATSAYTASTNFYGSSETNVLCTPNSWTSVVIGGTTYKIPLYT